MYFLWDITFIFFCLGFVSRTLTNHRTAGKGRGYFFLLLSTTSTCFVNRSVFSICSYQRDLMKNKNVASRSRNHTKFFYIKTLIRVNKGAGFLDLLLNISFQPLIIAVKHSTIIKLDVIELLDTCYLLPIYLLRKLITIFLYEYNFHFETLFFFK